MLKLSNLVMASRKGWTFFRGLYRDTRVKRQRVPSSITIESPKGWSHIMSVSNVVVEITQPLPYELTSFREYPIQHPWRVKLGLIGYSSEELEILLKDAGNVKITVDSPTYGPWRYLRMHLYSYFGDCMVFYGDILPVKVIQPE